MSGTPRWWSSTRTRSDARRITLYDGPIESVLRAILARSRRRPGLYGQVWTSGPQVVIRYYEAHPPDGEKVPICAVARLSEDQMRKRPESKPGTAILEGSMAAASSSMRSGDTSARGTSILARTASSRAATWRGASPGPPLSDR